MYCCDKWFAERVERRLNPDKLVCQENVTPTITEKCVISLSQSRLIVKKK